MSLHTSDGKEVPEERRVLIAAAMTALKTLTDEERGLVLCWFCRGCDRYVGAGDTCHCMNDE